MPSPNCIAFAIPTSISVRSRHEQLQPCRSRPNFATSPPTRRAHIPTAAATGWETTRQILLKPKGTAAATQHPDLPGVHFAQPPHITSDNLLDIIKGDTPDEWVNEIVLTMLGWRMMDDGKWDNSRIRPAMKELYPDEPPNFIGTNGDYTPETDRPVKIANQRLTRSIPVEHKQILKAVMKPLGFSGWKVQDLTPNRTRRATSVNWMLYWYRVHYPDYVWGPPPN